MALLKNIWNFDQTLPQPLFYDQFNSLNSFLNTSGITPEVLKNLQIQNLKKAYLNKDAYKELNDFIKKVLGDTQGTEEDLFAKLVQGINAGLDEFRSASNKINPNWVKEKANYYTEMNNLVEEINNVVNQASGETGIPMPTLDALQNRIRQHKGGKQGYIEEKANYLEEVGQWLMIRAGLAGFQTGSWLATDQFFNESSNAQLIEDAMGLLMDGVTNFSSPADNFIQVKIKGYKKADASEKNIKNQQLQEWVNSIKELNGLKVADGCVTVASNIDSVDQFTQLMRLINNSSNAEAGISIVLSDNLYQEIQKLSVNIQAKSNIERHLANKGNRSLYHINPSDNYYSKWVGFSQTKPVVNREAVSETEFNTPYEEFAAYVNLNLSQNINNTVYGRNEYYLTMEGFTDLATLMQKRGFYIRIADSMLSYSQFLANSYHTIYD